MLPQAQASASPFVPFPHSKRAHERLLAYWREAKGDRAYPPESDIDPLALLDIWESCFLITLLGQHGAPGFKYEYVGSDLLEAYGQDMTGRSATAEGAPHIESMLKSVATVAQSGEPVVDESQFTNAKGLDIRYRSCLLPVGNPTQGVQYILGCMRWRLG